MPSFSSRKYSAMVRPVSATRRRLPGGSFIWPYTIATFDSCMFVELDDARLDHLVIEVVAFAGTLADAGEHRQARVLLGDVVDQLEHVDGLADAGAAEQADLAALGERADQVDDLDAGFEQLLGRRPVRRSSAARRWMTQRSFSPIGPRFVHRRAEHVHDAAERRVADRHLDRLRRCCRRRGRASGLRTNPWRSCARRRRRAAAALRA